MPERPADRQVVSLYYEHPRQVVNDEGLILTALWEQRVVTPSSP